MEIPGPVAVSSVVVGSECVLKDWQDNVSLWSVFVSCDFFHNYPQLGIPPTD